MKYTGIICAAALLIPAAMTGTPREAKANQWFDGRPMFQSDVIREQRRLERERAERLRRAYPELLEGGPRPRISPETPPIVELARAEPEGVIIIDSGGRRLLYTLGGGRAYEYPISVGREGFDWFGTEKVSRIAAWPDWHPPESMRKREPHLPKKMTGGIRNPLGAKALYLGETLYRIHGTNDPKTIGRASSSGCFRMMNEHVMHLASLAGVGTEVRVVPKYDGAAQTAAADAL